MTLQTDLFPSVYREKAPGLDATPGRKALNANVHSHARIVFLYCTDKNE